MVSQWQYQVRFDVNDSATAELVRQKVSDPVLLQLFDILAEHRAAAKCQFDAFAEYVAAAEQHGIENYELYEWTKATIKDPAKKGKYLKSFTLYVRLLMHWRQTCSRSQQVGSLHEYPSTIRIRQTILSRRSALRSERARGASRRALKQVKFESGSGFCLARAKVVFWV